MSKFRDVSLGFLTFVIPLGTFVIDLLTPLGIADWAPYPVAIVTALLWKGQRGALVVTAVTVMLTILGAVLSPTGDLEKGLVNRSAGLLTMILLGGLCVELDRRRKALRDAEEKFRLVVESSPSGKVMTDNKGTIVLINAQVEKLFGYGREELLGHSVEMLIPEWFRSTHQWDRQDFFEQPSTGRMGMERDLYALRKDRSEFPIEVHLTPVQTQSGIQVLSSIEDVSERREIQKKLVRQAEELQRKNTELVRSNQELDDFAHIVSHDLKAPLRKVSGFSALLKRDYQYRFDEQASGYLRYIVRYVNEMNQLIDDLLEYSALGKSPKRIQTVDLNSIVNRVMDTFAQLLNETQAIVDVTPMPKVLGEETALVQLFQNLLHNAVKYRGDRIPKIHIQAQRQGEKWEIRVSDNGVGIDTDFVDQIFEPFRRLQPRTEIDGTGLGLAICRKVVEQHGGHIRVESERGKGSAFLFTLLSVPSSQPVQQQNTQSVRRPDNQAAAIFDKLIPCQD